MVNLQTAGNILNFVCEKSKLLLLLTYFCFLSHIMIKFLISGCCNIFPSKFCAGNWRASDQNLRLCACSSIYRRLKTKYNSRERNENCVYLLYVSYAIPCDLAEKMKMKKQLYWRMLVKYFFFSCNNFFKVKRW